MPTLIGLPADRRIARQRRHHGDSLTARRLVIGQDAGIAVLHREIAWHRRRQFLQAPARLFPSGFRSGQRLIIFLRQVGRRRLILQRALIGGDGGVELARARQAARFVDRIHRNIADRDRAFQHDVFSRVRMARLELRGIGARLVGMTLPGLDEAEMQQSLGIVGVGLEQLLPRNSGTRRLMPVFPIAALFLQRFLRRIWLRVGCACQQRACQHGKRDTPNAPSFPNEHVFSLPILVQPNSLR